VHKGNIRVMLKPNGAGSKLVQSYHYICSLYLYIDISICDCWPLTHNAQQKYTAITTGTDVNTLNKRLLHVLHLMHSRGVNMRCVTTTFIQPACAGGRGSQCKHTYTGTWANCDADSRSTRSTTTLYTRDCCSQR
jgi:hypothetical protein